jgi:glycosyltransferase involved in cell wall biosynthesis
MHDGGPTGPILRGRVLIIVQNLPVPFDRRVWHECNALKQAGHDVTVVCPKAPGDPSFSVVEGVELYKYPPYAPGGSKLSFVAEYTYSFLATARLVLKAARTGRFDVVQACNPPDIFWPLGWLMRRLHGSCFLFDHHDLCPELFRSRFPNGPLPVHELLLWLEHRTVSTADHVIATNESYRAVDTGRNGAASEKVTVVRNGPDPQRLKPVPPSPDLRRGRDHLVAYIGVMGPQDGVDNVLKVADIIVHELGRTDISFTLVGSGDCWADLLALREQLALGEFVHMTGRAPDTTVVDVLSTADIGISPDPKNPLNDVSTMNKTMEYMAFGLPVVAFDLLETRVSAAEAGVYATPNDVGELARLVVDLIDDEPRRKVMGAAGRARVESELAWPLQADRYVKIYEQLVAMSSARQNAEGRPRVLSLS